MVSEGVSVRMGSVCKEERKEQISAWKDARVINLGAPQGEFPFSIGRAWKGTIRVLNIAQVLAYTCLDMCIKRGSFFSVFSTHILYPLTHPFILPSLLIYQPTQITQCTQPSFLSFIHPFFHPFTHFSIHSSIHLSTCLSIYPVIYPSVYSSTHLSIHHSSVH